MALRENFQAGEIEVPAASARAAVESAAGKMQAVQHGVLGPRAAGCGFVTTFSLPFARTDVYRELARVDRPLGVGMDAHCEVTDGYGKPAVVLTLGCIRRISFDDPADGSTTSQLVAHRPDSELTWRQLQCDVRIGLVGGTEEGSEPVCSISLDDSAEGTLVSIHYAFHRVAARGPICLLLPCLGPMIRTQMQEGVPREWKEEMLQRGYTPETVQKRALSGVRGPPALTGRRPGNPQREWPFASSSGIAPPSLTIRPGLAPPSLTIRPGLAPLSASHNSVKSRASIPHSRPPIRFPFEQGPSRPHAVMRSGGWTRRRRHCLRRGLLRKRARPWRQAHRQRSMMAIRLRVEQAVGVSTGSRVLY
eukprot:scaffold25886_cov135-Isochrysis_galbana.AAC.1